MKIFKTKVELKSYLNSQDEGRVISFIPTMGALHNGHLSLISQAKQNSDLVVCSIFVNPTQFNNSEDLEKYPRTLDEDLRALRYIKCDVVYLPAISDLYNENEQVKQFQYNGLDEFMEGKGRRGHFDGVATVVEKLFRIINPNIAYFGQKDIQQLQIIKHITKQLNLDIEIIGVPTIREESGLAMSSRNKRLSESDLEKATLIYKTLVFIKENKYKYSVEKLKDFCVEKFERHADLDLEYLEIVSLKNLQPIKKYNEKGDNVACIAATINSVRLIDNIIF
ncbi:MAG: pantoate--beta-alanine ligase [Flavobacteriales bacterium]|nr:pantoate--beta-alanine ligase [Flavobacteriales bacterium]|tara:strand:+ start:201 stop:1040 length:840 start_codon:yes stop_codon:yes gene_type:complete